jgi:hypothetical protein
MRKPLSKIVMKNGKHGKMVCEECFNLVPYKTCIHFKGKSLCARCKRKFSIGNIDKGLKYKK